VQVTDNSSDVAILWRSIEAIPEPVARPVFVVVSGLPGSGKSYFCRQLARRLPLLILETDRLRKALVPRPSHSAQESARLFQACHLLIEGLLKRGVHLVLDATNLVEHNRERLYYIAEKAGAKLVLVQVDAPPEVIQRRLDGRSHRIDPSDNSDADIKVYNRMRPSAEVIQRNHLYVDTSRDLGPALDRIVREINRWERG